MNSRNHGKTRRLTGLALFTALVVILQLLGSFVRFGPFSISLVAMPIVIGAALYGAGAVLWLGFVFGAVVLISGDAAAFLAVHVLGTILVVLLKGTLCGGAAGAVYAAVKKANSTAAAVAAAVICPIVNTGIFLLGCLVFFMPTIRGWAAGMGFENVGAYMILGLVGVNFLVELGANILLCPTILRLIRLGSKDKEGLTKI